MSKKYALNKAGVAAVIAAFASDDFAEKAEEAKETVANYLLGLAKKAQSMEQFNAEVQKAEDWAKSEEGREAIKEAGYRPNVSKKGKFLMPRAWIQAASDLRATFKYGVDLNETTKDAKTGKVVPVVPTLSVARKLKTAAREAVKEQEDRAKGRTSDNHEAARKVLQELASMLPDLTEGQAAALATQLGRIRDGLKAAPGQAEAGTEQRRTAH